MIENGYPRACVERWSKMPEVLDLDVRKNETGEDDGSVGLPYEGLSEQIRRIVRKAGIKVAFKPTSWKGIMMEGVKDKVE